MREIIEHNGNVDELIWLFTSFREFHTFAASGTWPHKNFRVEPHTRRSRENKTERTSRSGGTWEEVLDLAKLGWLEKIKEMRTFKNLLINRLGKRIKKRTWAHDVTGTELDIGRYFSGVPDCWITPIETIKMQTAKKLIHITVNIACPSDIEPSLIAERGMIIGALIELLEYSGRRCKVTVLVRIKRPFTDPKFQALFAIVVKDFDTTLSMGRVLFAVSHAGMLRRLGFSVMEQYPPKFANGLGVGKSYGYPSSIPLKFRGDIHLDREFYTSRSMDPFEYLLKELGSQQVEFRG